MFGLKDNVTLAGESVSWFVFSLLVSCGLLEISKLINFDLMILQI